VCFPIGPLLDFVAGCNRSAVILDILCIHVARGGGAEVMKETFGNEGL